MKGRISRNQYQVHPLSITKPKARIMRIYHDGNHLLLHTGVCVKVIHALQRRNKKEHIFNKCSSEQSVRLNTDLCKLDHLEGDLKLGHDVRGSAC